MNATIAVFYTFALLTYLQRLPAPPNRKLNKYVTLLFASDKKKRILKLTQNNSTFPRSVNQGYISLHVT